MAITTSDYGGGYRVLAKETVAGTLLYLYPSTLLGTAAANAWDTCGDGEWLPTHYARGPSLYSGCFAMLRDTTWTTPRDTCGSYAVTVTDLAGNEGTVPFTVTRDASGPAASITATLDATTTTIDVEWSATDPGSGVEHYDVQYKVDDGEWVGWFTDTLPYGRGQAVQITGTLAGERGHVYGFRVQATDRARAELAEV